MVINRAKFDACTSSSFRGVNPFTAAGKFTPCAKHFFEKNVHIEIKAKKVLYELFRKFFLFVEFE